MASQARTHAHAHTHTRAHSEFYMYISKGKQICIFTACLTEKSQDSEGESESLEAPELSRQVYSTRSMLFVYVIGCPDVALGKNWVVKLFFDGKN